MHGWNDPYEPERTHGRGESWSSSGRRAAEPPGWPDGAPEEYGQQPGGPAGWQDGAPDAYGLDPGPYPTAAGQYGGYGGGYGGYARDGGHDAAGWPYENVSTGPRGAVYPAAGPDPSELTGDEPRRPPKPLVLAGIAAAVTLLIIVGVSRLLLHSDEGMPTTTAGDSTAAATSEPGGTPSELPSAAPSTPARPTPAPSSRASAPAAEPTRAVPPKRKGKPNPHRTRTTPSSVTASLASGATEAQQVIALVNGERADAGCDPLGVDSRLTTAAQLHSEDQAEHQNMSHTGSDGSTLQQRVDRVGYEWRAIGENVAYGQSTAAQVMDAWMSSEGHRGNIVNCQFEGIGVGLARDSDGRLYWTQDFGA